MVVTARASEETSAFKRQQARGRGRVDFSNQPISEMEYEKR